MTRCGAVSIASDSLTPPLPADLVQRFAAALERLNPSGGRIGLAVSGGPDSMAMLLLAHAAIPGMFDVATVNHGLRAAAADECMLVQRACAERGIACTVLSVEVGEGNVQAMARAARYDGLANWFTGPIATAHHADDQAETLLMRLNRGSGVAGLAGVREAYWAQHYLAMIIRPLLGFRRSELAAVVAAAGMDVVHDPSNTNDAYDRVRIRKALADADWLDPLAVAKSALHLAEANEALDHVAQQFWDHEASRTDNEIRQRLHPARAIRLRLLERAIRELGGEPRGSDLARLDSALVSGKHGNVAGVMVEPALLDDGPILIFRPEPPRRSD